MIKIFTLTLIFQGWNNDLESQQLHYPTQAVCIAKQNEWVKAKRPSGVLLAVAKCTENYIPK